VNLFCVCNHAISQMNQRRLQNYTVEPLLCYQVGKKNCLKTLYRSNKLNKKEGVT